MRHKKGNKKINKPTDQRIALLRSLSLAMITNSKIKSTDLRVKEAQKMIEKLITLGKKADFNSIRSALKILPNKVAVKKLIELSKAYSDRNGGYTKITKLGYRKGDSAPVSLLEFV